MSYVKLFKTVQDHAVGYQSVNQAVDNNTALVELYDARHSLGIGGNNPPGVPLKNVGRHDDMLIARSVADFTVDTTLATPTLTANMSGPMLGNGLQYSRLGTGQWQIYVSTPARLGAVALCKSTASVDRKASCYVTYGLTTGPAVIVTTWEIDTGAFVATDLDFSLVLWAERAA